MNIEIKLKAGQKVFWLSSKGFINGWIKSVQFNQRYDSNIKKVITELKFFLTCESYANVYMGDEVKEDIIFTSYKNMVDYYSKQPLITT